jgi:1-acyl-sn-glycerol-3-phosphate acyltransferase
MRFVVHSREDPWLYTVARLVLVPVVSVYGRFTFIGVERLPERGPAIVVSNHHSHLDPVFLGVSFSRPLHFMADVVQFRRGFVGPIIARLGAFPLLKGHPDRAGLERGLELLRRGRVIALFPEGDLYTDRRLHEFGRGLGFLALRSGAPVLPVGITGADGVLRYGRLRRPPVRLVVGPQVDLSDLRVRGHRAYGEAAERAWAAVAALLEDGPSAIAAPSGEYGVPQAERDDDPLVS